MPLVQNMYASVRIAQRDEPVSAADRELLHVVPVNARPARRLPQGSEPVSALCAGVTDMAERVRHAAWLSGLEPAWSPRVTVNSLRQVAAASTITSHHCEIVLRSLADGAEEGASQLRGGLVQAAEGAGRARSRWLAISHALDQVTTDTQEQLSRTSIGANDLALWAGRLAYADPSWRLATRPPGEVRPARTLAQEPEAVLPVIGAVYQAFESTTRLAHGDCKQVRAAANAGRILVTTGRTSDPFEAVLPFAPAPPERIDAIVSLYQYAARATAEAMERVSGMTDAVQVRGRAGTASSAQGAEGHWPSVRATETVAAEHVVPNSTDVPRGIERTLRALGVTDAHLLRRGAEIDRAGEQLIIEARVGREPQRRRLRSAEAIGTMPPSAHARRPDGVDIVISPDGRASVSGEALQAEP